MDFLGSLGRTGLFDWLIQRLTAVLLLFYTLFWIFYSVMHSSFSYAQWSQLFMRSEMRIITLLVLVSVLLHAWIGIWIVITDYVKPWLLRYSALAFFLLMFSYCLFLGVSVLWGR